MTIKNREREREHRAWVARCGDPDYLASRMAEAKEAARHVTFYDSPALDKRVSVDRELAREFSDLTPLNNGFTRALFRGAYIYLPSDVRYPAPLSIWDRILRDD